MYTYIMAVLKNKLIRNYVITVLDIPYNDSRFKQTVKDVRNEIHNIAKYQDIGLKEDIDIILIFNIYDNEYINSDYVIDFVLTKPIYKKEKTIRKKTKKKKLLKSYNRPDPNIKSVINIITPKWNGDK